ncbi:hypothetical protein RQM65_16755 [Pricia sp. S334]|uniref:Lipoprotein n=1 Tax=Pricia mediterranea TaxID=3076079 RepID=A0ABU3L9A0_9FLAO|nr:hypothetical protein [Pricia sp. S334]MDT7830321.1 hypothetical protein [Pricia sp. S334]
MKAYALTCVLAAVVTFGCSKSENDIKADVEEQPKGDADYTLLVNTNGKFKATSVQGNSEKLSPNEKDSDFQEIAEPLLISEEGKVVTMYLKDSACSGEIIVHDFSQDTSTEKDVFTDLSACNLIPKAIVKGGNKVYIAYEKEINGQNKGFWVRAIEMSETETASEDIALTYRPEEMVFSNDKLFILGMDEEITDEHKLMVIDFASDKAITFKNLGYDARTILKNSQGNVVVGYDEMHVIYDSATMVSEQTNYLEGKAPNFFNSRLKHFDSNGKMYYAMTANAYSEYPKVPAIYDFDENLVKLYAFENFLTEAQRDHEFAIENTTVVHYDEANNMLLVGYKKSGENNAGGMLRIQLEPNPKLAGYLDVMGVPVTIFVN